MLAIWLGITVGFAGCGPRDDQAKREREEKVDEGARKAGTDAYRAGQSAQKAADDAAEAARRLGKKIEKAADEARQGWNDAKRDDDAKKGARQ